MIEILENELIFSSCPDFTACHASTIEQAPDGSLCAAWFAGTREGNRDVDIFTARKAEGTWSAPTRLVRLPEPCWNPVLFAHENRLLLFFKTGPSPQAWRTLLCDSSDNGRSWSLPRELVPGDVGGRGPVKNKPIRLSDGRLVAPASIEKGNAWDCFTDVSFDGGLTWTASPFVPFTHQGEETDGIIQPTLWEDASGLHMLARSTRGRLYSGRSLDGGLSWEEAKATDFPNNNSGVDLDRLEDGRLLLVYNPLSGRSRDTIVCSLLQSDLSVLETLVLDQNDRREFSYPAVIARGSDVFLTYTDNRESIRYCHLIIG